VGNGRCNEDERRGSEGNESCPVGRASESDPEESDTAGSKDGTASETETRSGPTGVSLIVEAAAVPGPVAEEPRI